MARKQLAVSSRDLQSIGLPRELLAQMVKTGQLQRIARGLYAHPETVPSVHQSLIEVTKRTPKAIVCLLSALQLHEIGTQAPFEVWIALPSGTHAPRMAYPPLRVIRLSGEAYTAGVEVISRDGVPIRVYNVAKTITDCFKLRNKVGLDVALEALREAWRARKVTIVELWRYAKINRMTNVMRPYLEALTG
jgi:predicted transcriptional regulator of viral defense system